MIRVASMSPPAKRSDSFFFSLSSPKSLEKNLAGAPGGESGSLLSFLLKRLENFDLMLMPVSFDMIELRVRAAHLSCSQGFAAFSLAAGRALRSYQRYCTRRDEKGNARRSIPKLCLDLGQLRRGRGS